MTDKLQDAVQLACEAIAALEAAEAENASLCIRIAELESLCGENMTANGKEEFSEYIESIYAFGAERSVVWSDKALEAFEKYRESGR